MIGKNMKVGEKFSDGPGAYEVVKVNDDGTYVSRFIGMAADVLKDEKKEKKSAKVEAVVEEAPAEEVVEVKKTTRRKKGVASV